MNPQFEPLSRILGISRNLGAAALADAEELFSLQFDQAQACIASGSKYWRTALAEAHDAGEPGQWPEAAQQWIGDANAMLRDAFVSGMDYQLEMFRLVRKQTAEAQQLVSEAIGEQAAAIESTVISVPAKRGAKGGSAFAHKLAA